MRIEWDETKARTNFKKHGISFYEASSVFYDQLSATGEDGHHSMKNDLSHLVYRRRAMFWQSFILSAAMRFEKLAPERQHGLRGNFMSKPKKKSADEMLPEYKRSDFTKVVRGKYADRLRKSSNVVVIDPDLTKVFPNAEAVNAALRSLSEIAKRAGSKGRR